jgi:ELWxxDGT repeat protein
MANLRASSPALAIVFALGLGSTAAAVRAATPVPLGDLDAAPRAQGDGDYIGPSEMFALGDEALFDTTTKHTLEPDRYGDRYERALWATDGTTVGTRLLRVDVDSGLGPIATVAGGLVLIDSDQRLYGLAHAGDAPRPLLPATVTASIFHWTSPYVRVGERLLFAGCTTLGCTAWATDGTPQGTTSLGLPVENGATPALGPVKLGASSYLALGPRLVRSDGTPGGTTVLRDFGAAGPVALAATTDRLFLTRGTRNAELWVSDGTAAGTTRVRVFQGGSAQHPAFATLLAGTRHAYAQVSVGSGDQIVASDGTRTGTRSLHAGTTLLGTVGDRLLFTDAQGDPWTTDGTPATTAPLTGCPGGCPTYGPASSPRAASLQASGFLIIGGKRSDVGSEMWVTDGTGPGTRLLGDMCSGPCDGTFWWGVFAVAGRIFRTSWQTSRPHLWMFDPATTHGTDLGELWVAAAYPLGDALLMPGMDGDQRPHLWRVDPARADVREILLRRPLDADSLPGGFTTLGAQALFDACDGQHTRLFATDGTAEGTRPITGEGDAAAEPPCWLPPALVRFDGAVYALHGSRVLRSDGTAAGTASILETGDGEDAALNGADLVALAHRLLVLLDTGDQLAAWVSDGTAGGTHALTFDRALRVWSTIATLGDRALFLAEGGCPDDCLTAVWSLDADTGTLEMVLQVSPETLVVDLVPMGDAVYVRTGDGSIWRTEGTAATTRHLVPDGAGTPFSNPHDMFALGGALYFFGSTGDASDGPQTESLFRSNGTGTGTVPIVLLGNPGYDDHGHLPTVAGGRAFFRAFDDAHGEELWATDGTPAGTRVLDLRPGPLSSSPRDLAVLDDRIAFDADDGVHGIEPWISDGTPSGTRLLGDVATGPFSSWPHGFALAGTRVVFAADDGLFGEEPWSLEVAP